MKYRSEIDGLRAVAVLPVIFFHAGIGIFNGGYIGVDIFFVISGYLITTIIVEDLENKRFSLIDFYERRARRILPALYFVTIICIATAWFLMLPVQMKDFSQSVLAVTLFLSNVLFWQEHGYFDAPSDEKPLLHTWSLAVEEQYYLFFPVFLILVWRFGKNKVFWTIIIFSIFSLFLSELGSRFFARANFYLAPTRVWELFAGSMSAFIIRSQGVKTNNYLSLIGLCAILYSVIFFNKETPTPSFYTLIPVIGVMLIILYGGRETTVAKFLSTKLLVGVGLISYSAYLWHQPVFAFTKIILTEELDFFYIILLPLTSFFCAWLTWLYIEKPTRNRQLTSKRNIFIGSSFCFLIFLIFGIGGQLSGGYDFRRASSELPSDFFYYSYIDIENRSECVNNSLNRECVLRQKSKNAKTALLIGDSHSLDFQQQFINHYETRGYNVEQFSITGCGFIFYGEDSCKNKSDNLLKIIRSKKYTEIILVSNLFGYASEIDIQSRWDEYKVFIKNIALGTDRLWVFMPRFEIDSSQPIRNILNGSHAKNAIKFFGTEEFVMSFYGDLAYNTENIETFNQRGILLRLGGGLKNFTAKTKKGYPVYRDTNHITRYSAEVIFDEFSAYKSKRGLE